MATTIASLHAADPVPLPDRLIDDSAAALLLSVSRSKVEKLRRSGDLETVHVGRAARVRLSDVSRLIREGTE
jgi:excisionase family DNA binding protein